MKKDKILRVAMYANAYMFDICKIPPPQKKTPVVPGALRVSYTFPCLSIEKKTNDLSHCILDKFKEMVGEFIKFENENLTTMGDCDTRLVEEVCVGFVK